MSATRALASAPPLTCAQATRLLLVRVRSAPQARSLSNETPRNFGLRAKNRESTPPLAVDGQDTNSRFQREPTAQGASVVQRKTSVEAAHQRHHRGCVRTHRPPTVRLAAAL